MVQAITVGEDLNYLVRCAWLETHGFPPVRGEQARMVRDMTSLRRSRAAYELTISVKQAVSAGAHMRWVAGAEQLADGLTKAKARGILLRLLGDQQRWRLVYDPEFTAGRKLSKTEQEQRIREVEQSFILAVQDLAKQGNFPWDDVAEMPDPEDFTFEKLKSMTGASTLYVIERPPVHKILARSSKAADANRVERQDG